MPERTRQGLSLPPEWLKRFGGMRKEQVFDLVCSKFLELRDDELLARFFSEQHKISVTSNVIRTVRYDAAAAAEAEDAKEIRSKWAYRFQNATVNNVIKEYMFIAKVSSFLEAKMELGDELFWLSKKYSQDEIYKAFCEVIGREDIPPGMVDELVKFRDAAMRIKKLLKHYSESQPAGTNLTRILLDVAEKISDAYAGACEKNTVKTAEFTRDLLKLEPGAVTPADIDFLREYARSANPPERGEKDSRSLLLDGADSIKSRGILDEALRGGLEAISQTDARQMIHDLCSNPVIKPEQLKVLYSQVSKQLRRRTPGRKILVLLQTTLRHHMRLNDVRNLLSLGMKLRLRFGGVGRDRLQKEIDVLNSLATYEEALSYLHDMIRTFPCRRVIKRMAGRYCERRFSRAFVKEKKHPSK